MRYLLLFSLLAVLACSSPVSPPEGDPFASGQPSSPTPSAPAPAPGVPTTPAADDPAPPVRVVTGAQYQYRAQFAAIGSEVPFCVQVEGPAVEGARVEFRHEGQVIVHAGRVGADGRIYGSFSSGVKGDIFPELYVEGIRRQATRGVIRFVEADSAAIYNADAPLAGTPFPTGHCLEPAF